MAELDVVANTTSPGGLLFVIRARRVFSTSVGNIPSSRPYGIHTRLDQEWAPTVHAHCVGVDTYGTQVDPVDLGPLVIVEVVAKN